MAAHALHTSGAQLLPSEAGLASAAHLRLSKELEEAHDALVKALHGTILLAKLNNPCAAKACMETLSTMVSNVLREPDNDKFRRVRCSNEAFRSRVLAVKGGEEFLKAAVRRPSPRARCALSQRVPQGWRDQTVDFTRHLVLVSFHSDLLVIANRLLAKCQLAVAEKAERHEKAAWLHKNEDRLRRESALNAIAEDKERRREKMERELAARESLERAAAAAAAATTGTQDVIQGTPDATTQ